MYKAKVLMEQIAKILEKKVLPESAFVLDVDAGTGEDLQSFNAAFGQYRAFELEGIENDPANRKKLHENKIRPVHTDFLKFHTYQQYKIIMLKLFNESQLVSHLKKALTMQADGGAILCLFPASVYDEPSSKVEYQFVELLDEHDAEVIRDADYTLNGEETICAVVYIPIRECRSRIYSDIASSYMDGIGRKQEDAVSSADYLYAATKKFEIEVRAGIQLLQEYNGLKPHIMDSLLEKRHYKKPLIEMCLAERNEATVNGYIATVRRKYWEALLENPRFVENMTSNLLKKYKEDIEQISKYDFTLDNIRPLQQEISKKLVSGIEQCILDLFEELTYQNAWSGETDKNTTRYSGWKTNKCWIINKKVIMRVNAFNIYCGDFYPDHEVCEKIEDMEKAMNYLDGNIAYRSGEVREILNRAKEKEQTKDIQFRYFKVNFYKKGSMHVTFTNLELLKRLNIFGGRKKAWLPPAYGDKNYHEMSTEERSVIDAFQGEFDYSIVCANKNSFLWSAEKLNVPLLGAS